jgi:hypothetical protein
MLTSGSTGACTRVEVSASSSVGGQDARPGGASSTSSPTPGGNQCGSFSRLMPCLPARPPGHCQTDWRGGRLPGRGQRRRRRTEPRSRSGRFSTPLRLRRRRSKIHRPGAAGGLRNLSTARGTARDLAGLLSFTPWTSSSSDREWIRKGKKKRYTVGAGRNTRPTGAVFLGFFLYESRAQGEPLDAFGACGRTDRRTKRAQGSRVHSGGSWAAVLLPSRYTSHVS